MPHSWLSLDLEPLFMLSMIIMLITLTIYFHFGHVSIYSLFMFSSNKIMFDVDSGLNL